MKLMFRGMLVVGLLAVSPTSFSAKEPWAFELDISKLSAGSIDVQTPGGKESFELDPVNLRLLLQYRFDSTWSVETHALLPISDLQYSSSGIVGAEVYNFDVKSGISGIGGYLRSDFPMSKKFSLFGLAGGNYLRTKVSYSGTTNTELKTEASDGFGFSFGFGAEVDFSAQWRFRIDYISNAGAGDLDPSAAISFATLRLIF